MNLNTYIQRKINLGTIIMREYPETNNLDPYYPIRTEKI